jgi:hypothetical protein
MHQDTGVVSIALVLLGIVLKLLLLLCPVHTLLLQSRRGARGGLEPDYHGQGSHREQRKPRRSDVPCRCHRPSEQPSNTV